MDLAFAPNLSWLFPELPFGERARAAWQAGFEAVEFGFPSHADLQALDGSRQELGLQIVLFNLDVPVWDRANRGYLVDPRRRAEFQRRLDEALELARRLEAHKIMLPAGVELADFSRAEQVDCLLQNLWYAGPLAEEGGVLLTVEALNPFDNPGYFITSGREALELIQKVDHPQVRFQLDTYHIQLMEGNLTNTIRNYISWIGHIQFADAPGRHEPGTGEINFAYLTREIEAAGYTGYVGLEYQPLAAGAAALDWVPASRRSLRLTQ